ncbi:MAG: D-alanyl-lipoteichoic acid biosynthesis protein DltD [Chthoniobacter sp.]|uniref:D-alanyl-lipoteichoic acid biosynthesis protein DltD n=1 Tax=Chthoniobacter sp. TaxID=2510640 RepID=UPI0032A4AC03
MAIGLVALVSGLLYCNSIEQRYVHALAPDLSEVKLHGVVLQKRAFAQPDLLVLYGSSELAKEMPNNAAQFFQDYPTGFRVFPVGQPGTTSLAVLQKVAAVGKGIAGKKVAFSMSPGWFFTEAFDPKWYEGNFSHLQAFELAFSSDLSRGLKRDIARRMLDYPKTLDNQWLLEFTLRRLAGNSPLDRSLYAAIWPLGQLQNAIGRAQDHFEATLHILDEDAKLNALDGSAPRGLHALNWNTLVKRAAQFAVNKSALQAKRNEVTRKRQKYASAHLTTAMQTQNFVKMVKNAKEWTDLELLLRTFGELGAQPLLLSMPVEDIRLEVYGVSPEARTAYLRRLDETAARYDVALLDFREHQQDPSFLVDFLDHLSPQGWLYYNKALDDFYHERED